MKMTQKNSKMTKNHIQIWTFDQTEQKNYTLYETTAKNDLLRLLIYRVQ